MPVLNYLLDVWAADPAGLIDAQGEEGVAMTASRRAVILRLATAAYEMDLEVASGVLEKADDGSWHVGDRRLDAWLQAHEGEELVLVLGSLADERTVDVRTCRTCGRDYTDLECPYCRANRMRLRGR
jgi:hypothetical protein